MKEKVIKLLVVLSCVLSLFGCSNRKEDNSIVIWTSGEDYKNETYLTSLQEKFPNYDITLEYMNSSTIAAKVLEEGEDCEEYIELVVKQLELLKPEVIIERLTGDPIKENLLAPNWILNKTTILNDIDKLMRKLDTYQGIKY